ncbi:helix-turn-helix transcriptional regulator [Kiloniella sp.]|uniref:helix-turn-helix transcriptional regulator n=1 Tax=Kiloniella sp. TaxID=1938587 RepID=UPI003B01EB15
MVDLLRRQLGKNHSEMSSEKRHGRDVIVDGIKQAQVPLEYKANLLGLIWQQDGPRGVLSVGGNIREVEYDPIWRSALRSVSPEVLLDKWQRFEVFAHSRNRVRIIRCSDTSYRFERHTVDGNIPTDPENFLICGLLIALLEKIGCQALKCHMKTVASTELDCTEFCLRKNSDFILPEDLERLNTAEWVITWKEFVAQADPEKDELEAYKNTLLRPYGSDENPSLEKALGLLVRDVARTWKVEDLAHDAGLSKRSLQRKLKEIDLSFSHLVRMVRINEACRLLKEGKGEITTIGFCCGFSDSAHFSRDFRASMGMTPTYYRELSR